MYKAEIPSVPALPPPPHALFHGPISNLSVSCYQIESVESALIGLQRKQLASCFHGADTFVM